MGILFWIFLFVGGYVSIAITVTVLSAIILHAYESHYWKEQSIKLGSFWLWWLFLLIVSMFERRLTKRY